MNEKTGSITYVDYSTIYVKITNTKLLHFQSISVHKKCSRKINIKYLFIILIYLFINKENVLLMELKGNWKKVERATGRI